MNRAVLIGLACAAFIAGCAAPTAAPYAVEITDKAQYTADLSACATYALGYKPKFDFRSIGEGFAKGAAGNAASAAVNPWVPVIAGAGQATSAVINGIDLMDAGQRAVFLKCIDKKTTKDGSALVLDPNL
jgi:hypothetical protein